MISLADIFASLQIGQLITLHSSIALNTVHMTALKVARRCHPGFLIMTARIAAPLGGKVRMVERLPDEGYFPPGYLNLVRQYRRQKAYREALETAAAQRPLTISENDHLERIRAHAA